MPRDLLPAELDVAIVERELVAGECSYYACIPSKTILRPGEAVDGARATPGAAAAVLGDVDATAVLGWRDYMISNYDDAAQAQWLADNGIRLIRGDARIIGTGMVEVDAVRYEASQIVVATGSEPVIPPIPGLDRLEGVWTNREATGVREIPESLVILGGGPVGVELAQAFASLGTQVDLVEEMDHILPREPRPLGEALANVLAGERLRLHLGQRAASVRRERGRFSLSSRTEARYADSGCWWRPVAGREPRASVSRPRGRMSGRRGSVSTTGCAPARACGRSETSPGSGHSPTSASTTAGSLPPTSSARSAKPTTARFPGSCSPIPKRPRWEPPTVC